MPRVLALTLRSWMCLTVALLSVHAAAGQPKDATPGDSAAEIIDLTPENPNPNSNSKQIVEVLEPEPDAQDVKHSNLPRVEIMPDGEIALGCWLSLDGSRSVNPAGGPLSFEWQQTAGPAIPISSEELKQPKVWLYLAQAGDCRLVLRAKNEHGWSLPREVRLVVKPGRPFLKESEARRIVGAGELVAFPGEGWRQVCGAEVDLRYENGSTLFRPGHSGLYIFEAARAGDVPERRGALVPVGKDAQLGDRRPIAKIPKSITGEAGKPLLLNGSLSYDPDGDEETKALRARWITPERYRGVEIEQLSGLRARFKAPRAGTYSVQLVVSDGRLESEPPETCFIQINEAAAETNVQPDALALEEVLDFDKEDVRYRKVSLGLWGNLDRAVQLFPSRCGVALRIDPEYLLPEKFETVPLGLEVMDGPLMHLMDWITRQTGARYRRDKDRSFWLTTAAGWAKEEKLEAFSALADALYNVRDGSDLVPLIKPHFQKIVDARAGTSFGFEATRQEFQGVLPNSAVARLKEILAALRAPEGHGLPPLDVPSVSEIRLQKLLAEKTVTLTKTRRRLDHLLRDLSAAAGVAVAFEPRQFKELPYVDVNIVNAPLRDAVRTIVDLGGFTGCSAESPGGLWFYRGSRPYPTGELLWDHTVVRAYDLSKLLIQISPLSGEAIAYAIQKRVYPDSWNDIGAMVFYHPVTKKLLVMHGASAQRKALEFLHDLRERGEWALGPVDVNKP